MCVWVKSIPFLSCGILVSIRDSGEKLALKDIPISLIEGRKIVIYMSKQKHIQGIFPRTFLS